MENLKEKTESAKKNTFKCEILSKMYYHLCLVLCSCQLICLFTCIFSPPFVILVQISQECHPISAFPFHFFPPLPTILSDPFIGPI